ncbi:MAG: PQQ-binding-like beta-propeller repeat protein [Planctomycetota bacterium]
MRAVLLLCLCSVFLAAVAAAAEDRQESLYVGVADNAAEKLAELDGLVRAKQWDKAAEAAQKHIEAGGGLFETRGGVYVSFAEKVRRNVLSWPAAGIRAYRARYDAPARKLYDAAREARDVRGLAEVVRRYLPASAGVPALAALAELRGERGELSAAERALERAAALAPGAQLEAKLKAVRAALARQDAAAAQTTPGVPFEIGHRRWSFRIEDADVDAGMAAGLRARGFRVPRIIHPAAAGGSMFVQTTQRVDAVDIATGKLLWKHPERPRRAGGRGCADAVLAPVVRAGRVYAFVSGELVALAAGSGRRVWGVSDIAAEGAAPRGPNARAEANVLVNSAAAAAGKVFVCAAAVGQETESFVVAVDAQTGAVIWRRKLCSQAFRGILGRGSHPAPPVYDEGTVYVSTNLGAAAAIDAETGEVRWLARYDSFGAARRRAALEADDCWRNGPPVAYGGLLVAAPQDSDDLIAFDANTGRQRWRVPRMGMLYLAGAAHGRAHVTGQSAAAVDIKTGKVLWISKQFGRPFGRPALLARSLLIPVDGMVLELNAASGALTPHFVLRGPGNLVAAGDILLSASFDRIDVCRRMTDAPPIEASVAPAPRPEKLDKTKKLTPVWRTAFDTAHSSPKVVASDDSSVFVAARDRSRPRFLHSDSVERRRISDGQVIWRAHIGEWHGQAHLVKDKLIVRGAAQLFALDTRTGRTLWFAPGAVRETPPRIVDSAVGVGRAFLVRAGGDILAVDIDDGKEVWRTKLGEPAVSGSLRVIGKSVVVCGEASGTIHWLDAATGKTTRELRIGREDNRLTDRPAFQERSGRLCLVVGDREVRNVRLDTGRTLWKAEMPFGIGRIAATPDEGRIVVFPDRWSFGGEVTCFDAVTGKPLWRRRPVASDPAAVHVGDGLIVGIAGKLRANTMVAWETSDGKTAWTRSLPGEPALTEVAGAGQFVAGTGTASGQGGFCARAVIVRTKDGALVKSLLRPGSTYLSAREAGGALLLCSMRGIGAYRMTSEAGTARRVAELLKLKEPPLGELTWLLAAQGKHDDAMALLDKKLMGESVEADIFNRLHEQLMAIREMARERRATTYEAPFFRTPPKIDGRLHEDWRRDRAAMLDRPRHIERVQSTRSTGILPVKRDGQDGRATKRFWHGPNDLSATVYLAWDAHNLYLAVDVRDDVRTVHDFLGREWKGDCIIVAADPEGDGGYRMHGSDSAFWLGLAAKRAAGDGDEPLGGQHCVKIKEDESGIVYELALPWTELGVGPRAGVRFGLNIMVIDSDGGVAAKAASWTPGLTQNRSRDIMTDGIAPALFGTVILKER